MPPWPPGAGLPGKLTLRGGAGRPSRSGLSPSPLHLRFLLSRVESAFCWQWAVRAGERILSKVVGEGSGCWTTCILSEIGDELFQGPSPAFLYCTGWRFRSKLGTRSQPSFPLLLLTLDHTSSQPKPCWPSTLRFCAWGPCLPRGNSTLGSPIHSFIHFMGRFPAPAGPGPTWAGGWLMAVKRRPHARGTGRGGSGGWSTGRTLGVEPPRLLETGRRHPGAGAGLHPPIAPRAAGHSLMTLVPASTPFSVCALSIQRASGRGWKRPGLLARLGSRGGVPQRSRAVSWRPLVVPRRTGTPEPSPARDLLPACWPGPSQGWMPPGSPSQGHPGDRCRGAKRARALTGGNAGLRSRLHPATHW